MTKRCFICGAKEDSQGYCTNEDCPRKAPTAQTTQTTAQS
jgi:hypothetical protein